MVEQNRRGLDRVMQHTRLLGAYAFALALFVAPAAPTFAGGSDVGPVSSVPAQQVTEGKDTAGAPAPAAQAPAGVAPSSIAPSTTAPASVAGAPARAGGLQPGLVALALSGLGLLTLSGGVALRRSAL